MRELATWMDGVRMRDGAKRCLEAVCLTTMWVIWMYQNKLLFDPVKPRLDQLWDSIQLQSYCWINARVSKFQVFWVDWLCNPSVVINLVM